MVSPLTLLVAGITTLPVRLVKPTQPAKPVVVSPEPRPAAPIEQAPVVQENAPRQETASLTD